MFRLQKCSGPECPDCGCRDTQLAAAGTRWGRPWARFLCGRCEREFSLGRPPKKITPTNNGHRHLA